MDPMTDEVKMMNVEHAIELATTDKDETVEWLVERMLTIDQMDIVKAFLGEGLFLTQEKHDEDERRFKEHCTMEEYGEWEKANPIEI
jgi:hypothetical protein